MMGGVGARGGRVKVRAQGVEGREQKRVRPDLLLFAYFATIPSAVRSMFRMSIPN
jgi:hypothetical protein